MAAGLITYEEAIGAAPVSSQRQPPVSADTDAGDDHPLTVHLSPQGRMPPIAAPASTPTSDRPASKPEQSDSSSATAPSSPGLISYEDAVRPDTPHAGGILSNTADDSLGSSTAKGLGTTIIRGLAHVPGMFGDAMDFGDYLIARGLSKVTGRPTEDILRENAEATKKAGYLDPRNFLPSGAEVAKPILEKAGEYKPTSEPGRLLMAGGEAALGSLGFGGGLRALGANAAAGGVGQAATDLTNDPLAGVLAAGVAASGAQAGMAAGKKLGTPVVMGVPGVDRLPGVGPAVTTARDNAAAGQILRQSSDPAALREWAAAPPRPADVPGAPQTTAGAVGNDRGLFQAEKDARNVDNIPFNAIDRAQSDAQQAAITAAQPTGDVFRPGQVIRSRLNEIDAATQAAEDRLHAAHQEAVTGRAQANQQAEANLVQAFQDAHARSSQAASDAAGPLQERPNMEAVGATIRTAVDEARSAAKSARSALYDAVDPDGTLATVVAPVKDAKAALVANIDPHNPIEPTGAEAKIWSDIDKMPDVIPFQSLTNLDRRVTAAMSDARRNPNPNDPQSLSRLTSLKSAVMDAIHNGVENQAAHEARLVEAGVIGRDDTIEGRWEQSLERAREQYYADQNAIVGRAAQTGAGPNGAARPGNVRPAAGSQSSSRGRSDDAPGHQGVAGEGGLTPNFDAAASERLTAAKAAHADYAQTYGNPTIKPILADNGYLRQYTLPNGAIPSKAIVAGDKGYETAQMFIRAGNNDPRAISALQDAALAPLRKHVPPAGNLHPNALARWKENYGPALRALDEIAPGFSSRFDSAASATQALLDLGVQQRQALSDFQQQAAAQALVANRADLASLREGIAMARQIAVDSHSTPAAKFAGQGGERIAPAEVENAVGAMLKTGTQGATRMRSLVGAVAHDEDALAGLRKAGVDWMVRNFQDADGSLSGAKFIDFVRDNRDVLRELYPTAQVSMFGAIARNIEANAKWRTETAIKAGSDTAKNVRPLVSEAGKTAAKHSSMIVLAAEAMREGFDRGGVRGAMLAGLGAAGAYLIGNLRSAGINSVQDLYREALLDPEKARYLISKMPETPQGGKMRALTGLLRKQLIVGEQQVSSRSN